MLSGNVVEGNSQVQLWFYVPTALNEHDRTKIEIEQLGAWETPEPKMKNVMPDWNSANVELWTL